MTFQITLKEYWMGRDDAYPDDLTDLVRANAQETARRVNLLLIAAVSAGVLLRVRPGSSSLVASGWRPPAVNANIHGAAPRSKHMTAQACDIYDAGGALDRWLMTPEGKAKLEEIGLWQEHPDYTPTWCHVQIEPPKSGRRVFIPR